MNSEEKRLLAEQAYEKAVKYELDYGCCPQCVLATIQESVGIVDDETIKASHGLSGGGALMGQGACGALTGGLLALSARYGRGRDKLDRGRFINNFKKTRSWLSVFVMNSAELPVPSCRSSLQGVPIICGMPRNIRPLMKRAETSALMRLALSPSG